LRGGRQKCTHAYIIHNIIIISTEIHIEKIANKNEHCRFERVRRNVIFFRLGKFKFYYSDV